MVHEVSCNSDPFPDFCLTTCEQIAHGNFGIQFLRYKSDYKSILAYSCQWNHLPHLIWFHKNQLYEKQLTNQWSKCKFSENVKALFLLQSLPKCNCRVSKGTAIKFLLSKSCVKPKIYTTNKIKTECKLCYLKLLSMTPSCSLLVYLLCSLLYINTFALALNTDALSIHADNQSIKTAVLSLHRN